MIIVEIITDFTGIPRGEWLYKIEKMSGDVFKLLMSKLATFVRLPTNFHLYAACSVLADFGKAFESCREWRHGDISPENLEKMIALAAATAKKLTCYVDLTANLRQMNAKSANQSPHRALISVLYTLLVSIDYAHQSRSAAMLT